MASKCRKFVPNMFNKTKCQACFGSKEAHSAAALENNKATRKVSKCGYLFVAPNFDFSNPLDRTRRWQRRFFRLYDDGELTFSVDDHLDTVPQGALDMNNCTDILEAEVMTSHSNSLAVVTPDKTEYIKADSKEEIQWWHDVLVKFPNSLKALKTRRKPNFVINSNKENVKPIQNEENTKKPPTAPVKNETAPEKVSRPQPTTTTTTTTKTTDSPSYATFRGVRSLKHKSDKNLQEGLRKSSSLHDLTSQDKVDASLASSRFLSASGDRLDNLDGAESVEEKPQQGFTPSGSKFRSPRNSCPSILPTSTSSVPVSVSSILSSSSSLSSTSSASSNSRTTEDRASRLRTRDASHNSRETAQGEASTRHSRDSVLVDSAERRPTSSVGSALSEADDLSQSVSADETDSNETDELKDLVYMKKGWLITQGQSDRESQKHWFVLAGNSLRYFKDAKAEESNSLNGRIDLSTCYEVSELAMSRNYGFKIKTGNGEYTLAAMTAGIRSNWMKAIRLCMDLHSSTPKLPGLATTLTGKTLAGLTSLVTDDFDAIGGASVLSTATAVVTGTKGETAFQLVGKKEAGKKENRAVRRHHSEVNAGNVNKLLSIRGVVGSVDLVDSGATSVSGDGSKVPTPPLTTTTHNNPELEAKSESSSKTSKLPRSSSSSAQSTLWSQSAGPPLKRYVEGSDSGVVAPVLQSAESRRSKRNSAGENAKEGEKREVHRAKSPSARVKEKSRAAKTPRLHSPPLGDESFKYHRTLSGQDDSSQVASEEEEDLNMTISSEENYHSCGDVENQDEGHSDTIGEGSMMVEILESEVESLKERLDQTQSQLVKMQETNLDLKTRLQKEASQVADSGYGSSRWSQPSSSQQLDPSQTLKRQLKESKDMTQKQRVEIESLKSKLDMSVSKLTGTEKALSEALKEHKQEKDKVLKMSSEWNRRIRTLEGQVKDSTHKQERIRESLLNKERECRRLETEAKQHQQKSREQDREILKLKAVEYEYNQLKEQLDNRDRDLHNAHTQIHDKDSQLDKVKAEFEQQIREMESEFSRERDDLENHLEDLKKQLCSAEEQQSIAENSLTTNMADVLREKDDIIAQLEEKLIEHDNKMVDMQEELQAEMGENSDLAHNLEMVQDEKQKLQDHVMTVETHVLSLNSKVAELEKDSIRLRQQCEKLQLKNAQLSTQLKNTPTSSYPEKRELEKTIQDLNKQIQGLQLKLMERLEDMDNTSTWAEHEDVLHKVLVLDSDIKEINFLLQQLHSDLHSHISSLTGENKQTANSLVATVEEINHKCAQLLDCLQESSRPMFPDSSGSDYQHTIAVTLSSSSTDILGEYEELKRKFDRVVAELKKLKKEVNDVYTSYDVLQKKDQQLQETVRSMEASYSQQIRSLRERADHLSSQLSTFQGKPVMPPSSKLLSGPSPLITTIATVSTDTDVQLSQLTDKIQQMENTLAQMSDTSGQVNSNSSSLQSQVVVSRLKEMHQHMDSLSKDLKDIAKDIPHSEGRLETDPTSLESRFNKCCDKLGLLTQTASVSGDTQSQGSSVDPCETSCISSSGSVMARSMQQVMEKLQEIGEQLDCLDDGSDGEVEEEESTTVEEMRENLAHLFEFVKQHAGLSDLDWRVLQLVSAQKAVISEDRLQTLTTDDGHCSSKLQDYANRLSLEALVLVEMAHLLEKDSEKEQDPVLHELAMLNSKVLCLHQRLGQELTTMNVTEPSADVLRVQADILAEKILIEGHLHSTAPSASDSPGSKTKEGGESSNVSPRLLATEAILRSQLDAHIGHNLDQSCDEIWSSSSHLTTRSFVQGELTYALNTLKQHLSDKPHIRQSPDGLRRFSFERLKDRHDAVMEVAKVYQQKMVEAFALIIFKDSEELSITEGSGNVLDTVCSEISNSIETHIQHCKVKVRTAKHTQAAQLWDTVIDKLRSDREQVLTGIRQRHTACTKDSDASQKLDFPSQSLDSSIKHFGEIVSLCALLSAHLQFVDGQMKVGGCFVMTGLEDAEEDGVHQLLAKRLSSFVHSLAEGLRNQAQLTQSRAQVMLTGDQPITPESLPNIPHISTSSPYCDALTREAVFAAQTTFMIFKLKLLHEQEMAHQKLRLPSRQSRPQRMDSEDSQRDLGLMFGPLEEVVSTKHDDELEMVRVISSQVGKVADVLGRRDWKTMGEEVQQLQQKVQEELGLVEQRHSVHMDLFKQEQRKVEQMWEECQQERDHLEERCSSLELELHSMTDEHDDEVERLRQDVLTAVSAIRANEEESGTQLTDRVQLLTKQVSQQKDKFMKFLAQLRSEATGPSKDRLKDMLDRQLKDIGDNKHLLGEEGTTKLTHQKTAVAQDLQDKVLNLEKELELMKKQKDDALAEETRNTKAALDAMKKAYEEELQQERAKHRHSLVAMYNEDFVSEIQSRHKTELEKTTEELKQVRTHYVSKCEDLKLLEARLGQTKQDYEAHINQLIKSNSHLDDIVSQEIEQVKEFIKKRPDTLPPGSATMEEELYDAQIMIRVKDTELQKLRSQVKNFESSLHHTTEEHKQTMTQYLQAVKENQEMRKEYETELTTVREQLDKALIEAGLKKSLKRTPSLHLRARSPSPGGVGSRRRDCTSVSAELMGRDSSGSDHKDLRRSKSSPTIPLVFDNKSLSMAMKLPRRAERRLSEKL